MRYVKILAVSELLTRPLREAFESGEMSWCHDDNSVTLLQAGELATNPCNNAGAFEGSSSVANFNLACVDEDVLYGNQKRFTNMGIGERGT